MPDEKDAKKITGRSSRQDIWSAYNELLEKTEAKPIEPKISDDNSGQKSLEELSGLKIKVARAIDQISQEIATNLGTLDLAREEVAQEKKRMIAALNEQKISLEDEIKLVKKNWEKQKTERFDAEGEEARKKTLARGREEDEYKFNLERQRRDEKDKFEQEIEAKRAEITKQKEELENRKAEIREMEQQIAASAQKTEKAIAEAKSQLASELNQKHAGEIKEMKLIAQNKEDLAKAQIVNLEAMIESLKKEDESLKTQLADSSRQLKEMAVSAIESHSQTRSQSEGE